MTARKNIWKGRYYQRGGILHDKHNNIKKVPITFRQIGSGVVVDKYGNFLGYEKPLKHHFGRDEKKGKKPSTFVRPNQLGSIKPRRGHIRQL